MRILAFAYACEPGEGSEPGAGWAWAHMLARLGETWVVTRRNNRPAIEAGLAELPEAERPHFVYVDLPAWARWWKRGRRGIHVYYLLWQAAALTRARRLHRDSPFDLVWHLTMANAWLGTTAPLLGTSFVYGPVGGGVSVPWRMVPVLGPRGTGYEIARRAVRGTARYLNPLARLAWRRADLILVQNEETRRWFPQVHRRKVEVFPNVVLDLHPPDALEAPAGRTALFAGRLVPWKGAGLAIRTLTALPGWMLLVCGRGSDRARLEHLARRLGVRDRVRFLGEVPRPRLLEMMRQEADVFLFPSLREEAGWVVAEAVACGLPVVCVGLGGPPLLGARHVPPSGPVRCVEALAREVLNAAGAPSPLPRLSLDAQSERLSRLLGTQHDDRGRSLPTPVVVDPVRRAP